MKESQMNRNSSSKMLKKKSLSANGIILSSNSSSNATDATDSIEVKCNCKEHIGKEYLNEKFDMSVDYLYECLFGEEKSEFAKNSTSWERYQVVEF